MVKKLFDISYDVFCDQHRNFTLIFEFKPKQSLSLKNQVSAVNITDK